MGGSVGQTSVRAAGLNMVTQVAFRLVTFAMNAFVLRHISRDVLGLINVRLNLLDDTILFLSRESFRLACLGHSTGRQGWQQMVNLMWVSVPVAAAVAAALGWVWASLLPAPALHLAAQYGTAVWVVAAAGVLQMAAEAPWVAAQLLGLVRVRVALDTVWVATRAAVLVAAVAYTPDRVVEAWAAGHALASLLYVLGHYAAFHLVLKHPTSPLPLDTVADLLPSLGDFRVDSAQRRVAASFLGQGAVKQLLTEGERYVMTVFSLLSLPEQGVYDVVTNLGSLAARFVFRPVEESAYFFFSQLWRRAVPLAEQEQGEEVAEGLHRLLRLMLLLGLLVFALGISYCHLLLTLYGGGTLAEGAGPDLLRAQCLLVLLLAVNGVTECFARSAMTEGEIQRHTRAMSAMSVAYLALAYLLTTHLGPVGFTFANCLNMCVRVLLSLRVIWAAFAGRAPSPLLGLLPPTDLLLLIASGGLCCHLSELYLYPTSPATHLAIGVTVGVILVLGVIVKEDFILAFIVAKIKGKKEKDEADEEGDEVATSNPDKQKTKAD